jgi:hypothetical protein
VRWTMAVPHLSQQSASFFGMALGAIETMRSS